ncbi:Uncharacterized protein HZ326_24383 [Fusarium oxysporum f. sp. albedinis]|nr:Uncharacterized protein HZ326_24383 [Fusarium oxysporum f. sp. albedinis]
MCQSDEMGQVKPLDPRFSAYLISTHRWWRAGHARHYAVIISQSADGFRVWQLVITPYLRVSRFLYTNEAAKVGN